MGLGGIFDPDSFKSFNCSGNSPWLPNGANSPCEETLRAVQRNSSSLYLPKFESAIDIPPWTHVLEERLSDWWPRLNKHEDSDTRLHYLDAVIDDINADCQTSYTAGDLNNEIQKLKNLDREADDDLKVDEYAQFMKVDSTFASENKEFQTRLCNVALSLDTIVDRVVAVERLREVRAIYGFSRLSEQNAQCELSNKKSDWLPAAEVRGEGIFINFQRDWIDNWSQTQAIRERFKIIEDAYSVHAEKRGIPEEKRLSLTPEFLLIHTLSHLIIRQISLQCGYSTASLGERLYAHDGMSGLLIYTATSDSDGTLGGLCRLAQPDRLEEIFLNSVETASWCSSDPLCLDGVTSFSEPLNLAACHACILLPETSCEHLNYFLDRALIPGIPEHELPSFAPSLLETR